MSISTVPSKYLYYLLRCFLDSFQPLQYEALIFRNHCLFPLQSLNLFLHPASPDEEGSKVISPRGVGVRKRIGEVTVFSSSEDFLLWLESRQRCKLANWSWLASDRPEVNGPGIPPLPTPSTLCRPSQLAQAWHFDTYSPNDTIPKWYHPNRMAPTLWNINKCPLSGGRSAEWDYLEMSFSLTKETKKTWTLYHSLCHLLIMTIVSILGGLH